MKNIMPLTIIILMTSTLLLGKKIRDYPVHGFIAPGFEEVRNAFESNFRNGKEIGAACCVYYQGEKVVDLWGGYRDRKTREPWEENTVVRVYSTTKGMSLLVLAHLHSRGLLDYNEKVAAYWPGFGIKGKEDITVEQLITHKAGLVLLERPVKVSELHDREVMTGLLENAEPLWKPGTKHGYQSATIGLYIQQLVQRIDPAGRSIGQYFRDEIARPLQADFYIGLPDDFDPDRLATLKMINPIAGLFNLHKVPQGLAPKLVNPFSLMTKSFTTIKNDLDDPVAELQFEEAAGGGAGTARALANVYGTLACGGEAIGLKPVTMKILSEMTAPPADGIKDVVMGWESLGSRGGYAKPTKAFNFGSSSAFGFVGSGGSFAFADPEHELGFAYVMNRMDFYGQNDPREVILRETVYDCIKRNTENGRTARH